MRYRAIRFGLFLLGFTAIFVLALAGCGGGGGGTPSYDDPIVPLGGGATKDVSRFNGTCIYTLITPQPAGEPESDDPEPSNWPYYSFILYTTAAQRAPEGAIHSLAAPGLKSTQGLSISKQAEHDLKMRRVENGLLRSGARRLSVRAAPKPIGVGTTWDGVYVYNTSGQPVQINTTCRYISGHAYFFVDNRDIDVMEPYFAGDDGYGAAFDRIYQINHEKFGTENDVDDNGKVIIVFSQELTGGLLGYFYAIDKFTRDETDEYLRYSNEADIFYITTDTEWQGTIVKATLAHEFQHMIYFDEHYDRQASSMYAWLNEALSQAAEYYSGYLESHQAWIAHFLNGALMESGTWYQGLSLTHWTPYNYGYGAVFIRYLIDQYGDAAIKKMCATDKAGVKAVEAATGRDFNTIFTEFARALAMSGAYTSSRPNPRYRFTTLDLQEVQPEGRGGLTTPYSLNAGEGAMGIVPPYSLCFIQWSGPFGTMNLSGDPGVTGTAFGLDR